MKNDIIVSLQNIAVEYDGERVVDNLNLDIRNEEFITFLGPSGCGKTTTLRIIGGFAEPAAGDVFFEGKRINGVPPYQRHVNTVFQRYALFPHLNVFENIAFGLKLKKMAADQVQKKVQSMLKLVNLSGYENRNINQLSGGQQQRVAIARALINEPKVLLLDEPLGALDLKLRKEMQIELKRIQQALKITFIYVTHDQEEALTMSDRVIVMRNGKILQSGTPQDIYNEPANAFVADFIGESNILSGVMHNDYLVEFAGVLFECEDSGFEPMEAVEVVIRPEDIDVVPLEEGKITGRVEDIVFKGVHFEITVSGHGFQWMIHSTDSQQVGEMIGMTLTPNDIHVMRKMEEER
ncbi:ABC transporter ATP-binding protein [Aminipila butyrica]|uniref:Spermidine/putrescine import ATP-binding protein PotA n=1 Tax=Aminipila butyrica TaxID=433296 RepID=A0A858BVJ3_9FIRM|nr:spermidine/putrescine ABC transporter ATP-binding protein [Aminipila butyrica]QIB68784.1 ABC transporter ATP-binding protein [Aminipila butyrica]